MELGCSVEPGEPRWRDWRKFARESDEEGEELGFGGRESGDGRYCVG